MSLSAAVSHAKTVTIANFTGTVTVGNSTGGTQAAQATDLVLPTDWNAGHNITVNIGASDLSNIVSAGYGLSVSNTGTQIFIFPEDLAFFEPFVLGATASTVSSQAFGSLYVDPFVLPNPLFQGQINVFLSCGAGFLSNSGFTASSAGSVSQRSTLFQRFAIYAQQDTNLSGLATLWMNSADWYCTHYMTAGPTTNASATLSRYATISVPTVVNASGVVSYSTYSGSGTLTLGTTTTTASTAMNSIITQAGNAAQMISGSIMQPLGFNTTLGPGNYWFGHMFATSSALDGSSIYGPGGTVFSTQSIMGMNDVAMMGWKSLGSSVSTTSGSFAQPFHGYLATSTASSIVSSMGIGDVIGTTGRAYWNFVEQATTL